MLASRIGNAIDRLEIYAVHAKGNNKKRVRNFIDDMRERDTNLKRSISRLKNSIRQINNAIAKSSPDVGLDPQMEPLITMFVGTIEDSYNEANDYISHIKEFEATLLSEDIIQILLSSTDSVIAEVTAYLTNTSADKKAYKSIMRAQKLQEEAYDALRVQKKKQAAKLTNEAYYTVINIIPTHITMPEIETLYNELVNQLITTEALLENSEDKKANAMYDIAMNRARKANIYRTEGDLAAAQKQLSIGGYLIMKVVRMLKTDTE